MSAPVITSEVQICNLALSRLGQSPITSLEVPTTKAEEICSLHFSQTREKVLRKYIFNFAKKLATLTVDATKTPAFGYTSAYALPNDFVRLLSLGDTVLNSDISSVYYDLSDGYIFTDYENGGTLDITYIYNCTTVTKYDPLFIEVLSLELAADVAYAFTAKPSIIARLKDELVDAQLAASAVAGQEKPPRRIQRSRWKSKRTLGCQNITTEWGD